MSWWTRTTNFSHFPLNATVRTTVRAISLLKNMNARAAHRHLPPALLMLLAALAAHVNGLNLVVLICDPRLLSTKNTFTTVALKCTILISSRQLKVDRVVEAATALVHDVKVEASVPINVPRSPSKKQPWLKPHSDRTTSHTQRQTYLMNYAIEIDKIKQKHV